MSQLLTGSLRLTRFELRRDRVLAPVWMLVLLLVVYASAAATESLYPTDAERIAAAELINSSPATVALYGPILDVDSVGEVSMTKTTVLYALFLMILAVMLVRRHTRGEEESGRAELLAAGRVGRHAQLLSAVTEATVIVTATAVLAALASIAGGLPVQGSVLFGASWWGCGLVGAAVGAVSCQLSASARTCGFIAAGALGVMFLVRAVGDVTETWVSWLSPLGWNTQLRAWSEPRVWVLLLYVVAAGALFTLAVVLRDRRDLGSGLVAARPGPAEGSPRLRDVVALTIRVHATALVAWTLAAVVMGTVFGSLVPNLGSLFESATGQEMLERLGGAGSVQDAMLAGILSVVAMVLTGFALSVTAHGGADERDGRTEQVLATATPRSMAFGAIAGLALLGSTWLLLVTGVGAGLGYGIQADGLGSTFAETLGAALAPAPAVWLVAAIGLLGMAMGSRWAWLGWAALTFFVTVGLVGEILRLPDLVISLSPYQHIPKVPSEPWEWTGPLVLCGLTMVLVVAAWWSYRRRDIGS
ncbi:MAG: hypothetical protein U0R79_00955 [Propionicimonas sp.]